MTTASPGQFDPLAAVDELHAPVRKWTEHIPQNLPYVDLMFAFGFATLGDRPRAEALVEAARQVMQVPIPPRSEDWRNDPRITAALVTNFLFKGFKYRVDQALAGKPHAGALSEELAGELNTIRTKARAGSMNNPYLLAEYVIDMMRVPSRILEPDENVDPYRDWTKNSDPLQRALFDLSLIGEPAALATAIRKLLCDGVPGKQPREVHFEVLREALSLASRAGEAITIELLEMLPGVIADTPDFDTRSEPYRLRKRGEAVARGVLLASRHKRRDLVTKLIDAFVKMIGTRRAEGRLRASNVVAGECLRVLKKFGFREEMDRFVTFLQAQVPTGVPASETRLKRSNELERWVDELQTLLHLAAGYFTVGLADRAATILDAARWELLTGHAISLQPKDYVDLARTYVTAMGAGPSELALVRMLELFREMDPKKVTNTWTMAQHYSRFHMNLIEDTVLAVCRMDFAAPHIVSA